MAEHDTLDFETASGNDYEQHEATYRGFVRLVKWVVAAHVVALALMAWFLT